MSLFSTYRCNLPCSTLNPSSAAPALQISGHPVIAPHLNKMFGIRNGIDQELWDPSIDEHLPQNFGPEDVVEGKAASRRELRRRCNLADIDVPLVRVGAWFLQSVHAWVGNWGGVGVTQVAAEALSA